MCTHCEALARAFDHLDDEDCENFNPEESDTPPADPFDSPSYRDAA